jgi:hypothetical protein
MANDRERNPNMEDEPQGRSDDEIAGRANEEDEAFEDIDDVDEGDDEDEDDQEP